MTRDPTETPASDAAADQVADNADTSPLAPPKIVRKPGLPAASPARPIEIGGPAGPEPTRYGDWEVRGRCSDF